MSRFTLILVAIAVATTGCDMIEGDANAPLTPTTPADPTTPTPDPLVPQPTPATVAGTYEVTTSFDLTLDVVLPGPAHDTVLVLRDFRDDPAATMFALLDDAGVPLVGDLMDALPGALEDKLMGWINSYLEDALFQDTPVMAIVDEVLAISETSLTRFDMISELQTAAPLADGTTGLAHRITGLDFPALGLASTIEVPDLGPLTHVEATAWVERDQNGIDADLVLGDHGFGLPYGEYAFAAVEQTMQARYGMSVRESLGAAIDCPALAAEVADQCVLGLCVGHQQELRDICEQGLDLAVDQLREKFASYRIDALELDAGEAELLDADTAAARDGQIDIVRSGLWQARIDLGQGLREIGATFTGVRVQP